MLSALSDSFTSSFNPVPLFPQGFDGNSAGSEYPFSSSYGQGNGLCSPPLRSTESTHNHYMSSSSSSSPATSMESSPSSPALNMSRTSSSSGLFTSSSSYSSSPSSHSHPCSNSSSPFLAHPLGAMTLITDVSAPSSLASGTTSPLFGFTAPPIVGLDHISSSSSAIDGVSHALDMSHHAHTPSTVYPPHHHANTLVTTSFPSQQLADGLQQPYHSDHPSLLQPHGHHQQLLPPQQQYGYPVAQATDNTPHPHHGEPSEPEASHAKNNNKPSPKRVGVRRRTTRSASNSGASSEESSDSVDPVPQAAPKAPQKRKYTKAPAPVEHVIAVGNDVDVRATRSYTRGGSTTTVPVTHFMSMQHQQQQQHHHHHMAVSPSTTDITGPLPHPIQTNQLLGQPSSFVPIAHQYHDAAPQSQPSLPPSQLQHPAPHYQQQQQHISPYPTPSPQPVSHVPVDMEPSTHKPAKQQRTSASSRRSPQPPQQRNGEDDDIDEDDDDTVSQETLKKQRLAHKASLARAARAKRKTLISSLQNDVAVLRQQLTLTQEECQQLHQVVQLSDPQSGQAIRQRFLLQHQHHQQNHLNEYVIPSADGQTNNVSNSDGPLILVDTSQLVPPSEIAARLSEAINLLIPVVPSIRHQDIASECAVERAKHTSGEETSADPGTAEAPSTRSHMAKLHFRDINQSMLDRSNTLTNVLLSLQSLLGPIKKSL